MYLAKPGDILLYRKSPSIGDDLIIEGESFEDGRQDREYYHVAIALDANNKIEAYGKSVAIHPIDYGNFDAFRPPIGSHRVKSALAVIRRCVGQGYDWWLIIDDAIRYLTKFIPKRLGGPWHLPVSFIQSDERRGKVCSSLAVAYLNAALWGPKLGRNASPEDIYLAVKDFPIYV
ncbi:hypothetical protein NZD89_06025 [Alicyclobacillus fastidiosus]|uniref:Permuted papain-like amidase YaeF/Yiix C92 family enzyme n=1 Tax=Alicyclobacillus fastidiosus TaxID=392011 RepID=A0ABY6ZJE2_9BACL|nr:hypothetical protein [Alicyclobacillus fastidiosus]WAH42972.1 hypothetical protein NZD89_06025 [Alicyclobacillus fastidiosus]GMA64939.1 hypothetical protein GCM10025859_53790 [Alicyclobacillus fastidiosus]